MEGSGEPPPLGASASIMSDRGHKGVEALLGIRHQEVSRGSSGGGGAPPKPLMRPRNLTVGGIGKSARARLSTPADGSGGGGEGEDEDEDEDEDEGEGMDEIAREGGAAAGGGGSAAAAAVPVQVPVVQSVSTDLEDFWKVLWHSDVHKDHPKDYNQGVVNNFLPNSNIGRAAAPAGRNTEKTSVFQSNCGYSPDAFLEVGRSGTISIQNCSVPGTTYDIRSFIVNSIVPEDCKRLEGELKGFLESGSFLKYIDTTKHGGELLTHWDNSGGAQLFHAHTALIEMDPAYKINPATNRDQEFIDKFFYEATPSKIEYPAFTQGTSNHPLTYTYCNKPFFVHNYGLFKQGDPRKHLNTKFIYLYDGMPIELTGKSGGNDNTAGNLCKFLSKITNALGLTQKSKLEQANTEAFFVSKHHGDIGQVLEQYRPSNLVNQTGQHIVSNTYNFIFESIDINAISKALSIGVDYVFMHLADKLVVFKNTKLNTPATRLAALKTEAEREITSLREYIEVYNANVGRINANAKFYTDYKASFLGNIGLENPSIPQGVIETVAAAAAEHAGTLREGNKYAKMSKIDGIINKISDAVFGALEGDAGTKRGTADAYACNQIANPNEKYKFILKKMLTVCMLGEYIPNVTLNNISEVPTLQGSDEQDFKTIIAQCRAARSTIPAAYMSLNILDDSGNNLRKITIPETAIFEYVAEEAQRVAAAGALINCSAKMEYQWDMINIYQTSLVNNTRRKSVGPRFHKEWATDILIHLHKYLPEFPRVSNILSGALSGNQKDFFTQILTTLGINTLAAAGGGGAGGGGGGGGAGRKSQSGGSIFSKTFKKKNYKNKTLKLRAQSGGAGEFKSLNEAINAVYADEKNVAFEGNLSEIMLRDARLYLRMLYNVDEANGNIANQRIAISEFMAAVYSVKLQDEPVRMEGVEEEAKEEAKEEAEQNFIIDIGNTPYTIYNLIEANPENREIRHLLRLINGNTNDSLQEAYYDGVGDGARQMYELALPLVQLHTPGLSLARMDSGRPLSLTRTLSANTFDGSVGIADSSESAASGGSSASTPEKPVISKSPEKILEEGLATVTRTGIHSSFSSEEGGMKLF